MNGGSKLYLPVLAAVLWVSFAAAVQAQQAVKRLTLGTPRAFGYVIGDVIEHRVQLELADPFHLDQSSLPEAGQLNRWLELAEPIVHIERRAGTSLHEIVLDYQIFYSPAQLESIAIPGFELSVADGARTLPIIVPEWRFWIGPLAPPRLAGSVALPELRADQAPYPIAVSQSVYRILAFSAILSGALLYLAHYMWGIPWLERRARPFAKTLRALKRLEHQPFSDALHLDALRSLHHAFNTTAGQTLFPENLDVFFARHPEYEGLREPIERLFLQSQGAFFDTAHREAATAESLRGLTELCRKCRRLERAAA